MSLQRKRPAMVQQAIAQLTVAAVERGDSEAAEQFARHGAHLARLRQAHNRELARGRYDAMWSLGMRRTSGGWE